MMATTTMAMTGGRAALAFGFDAEDPAATRAAVAEVVGRALAEGRLIDAAALCRTKLELDRAFFARTGRDGEGQDGAGRDGAGRGDGGVGMGEAGVALELRTAQRPPEGLGDGPGHGKPWSTWLFLGGRGAGKTLAGASWLADQAMRLGPPTRTGGGRLALIGPTLHDVREVMVGGASGILSLPRWRGADGVWKGPVYEPTRRRLRFPNGAVAQAFSAEDPDSLRGPQFVCAWADEFCAWRAGEETLALLRMGLRLEGAGEGGDGAQAANRRAVSDSPLKRMPPQLCVTTTPRPTRALKALRAEASCVQTHAGTRDNAEHLAAGFIEGLEALYGGTRRAAQELDDQVVDAEGGLFPADIVLKACLPGGYRPSGYLSPHTPGCDAAPGGDLGPDRETPYDKVVVAVDPTATAQGDPCGIVVVGRKGDTAVVLADRSVAGLTPDAWARRALRAAEAFGATTVVAEVNQGGDMVEAVLRTAREDLIRTGDLEPGAGPVYRPVRASTGKAARAEPVAALYEQGRVKHAGRFRELEEELMAMGVEDEAPRRMGARGRSHGDRADALVWAVTALLLSPRGGQPGVRFL